MNKNYIPFHLHSDFSVLDSATKFDAYIQLASSLGMSALGFSEHGNFFEWTKKKQYCEDAGLKYIHGIEMYVTESLDEKVRDNYHCVLIAKNLAGVKELNKLSSVSYQKDGHFYYNPRISIDELTSTSDNIIVSTACLGSVLSRGTDTIKDKFVDFLAANKERCFLEIQHHNDSGGEQAGYNQYLWELSKKIGVPLWAGTDTHSLNDELADVRKILQRSKNIRFPDEDEWNLTFMTYEQLVNAYRVQNSLPEDVYLDAIEKTNILLDIVEDFELDYSYKYPKISDEPEREFREKVFASLSDRGLSSNKEYVDRVEYEIEAFKRNGALDYMLLQEKIITWCKQNNIFTGISRGSVSGSICAYLLGITEIDSIKYNMNFERFMNLERVSLSDIDLDYPPNRREDVRKFIFDEMGLNCCDIVAFNTVAEKGSIRDVGRAMDIPLSEINKICKDIDSDKDKYEKDYPELFKYANLLNGVITSTSIHPCGVVMADENIAEELSLMTSTTNEYPISQLDMKAVDRLNFVKLDILGLDNVQIITETCELAGIERLTPDNIDFEDEAVWMDITKNTLGVFQWESPFAHTIYRKLFSEKVLSKIKERTGKIDYLSLMSMGNGAIRPAGESYRDNLCEGVFKDNGNELINEMLSPTLGYLVFQEQIIEFLNRFCGFSMGEADIVRRGFAKKTGTDQYIPKIESGFIKTMKKEHGLDEKESKQIIQSFLRVIEDASSYLFSSNHSVPYSMIGYTCAWLRYYHKIEFITTMLRINKNNFDKTNEIINYAKDNKINVLPPRFGKSRSDYFFDKSNNSIYRGTSSIKFITDNISDQLYELGKNTYDTFVEFLIDAAEKGYISKKYESLIMVQYFEKFGNNKKLLAVFEEFTKGDNRYSSKHKDDTKRKRIEKLLEYEKGLPNDNVPILDQLTFDNDILGYINTCYPHIEKNYIFVMDVDAKFAPRVDAYCLANGKKDSLKIQKRAFNKKPFQEGDILYCHHFEKKRPIKFINGQYVDDEDGDWQWWITDYDIVNPEVFNKKLSQFA